MRDADEIALAAAGIHVEAGALGLLGEHVPGRGRVALVSDRHVAGIHGADAQLALGARLDTTHELPSGEAAKSLEQVARLWDELGLGRDGTLVALGGGCATDAAGFAASAYLRGIPWVPVPTTLVGQVDAAIGGKTAVNLAAGKNLVGAFHWPVRTVIDPSLLATLPEAQRLEGMAEVVKTGLLAGLPLWELTDLELVRHCAAYKAAVCLRDPHDRGPRNVLNLGHTFAHALEAAGGYGEVSHGRAVALGLLAALRLTGVDDEPVRRVLDPRPVRVDRERAWAALQRDKKARDGEVRLVLLDAPGPPALGRGGAPGGRPGRARLADRLIESRAVRIDVLNGVNLDVLGRRDPKHYGHLTLSELETRIYAWAQPARDQRPLPPDERRRRVRRLLPRPARTARTARSSTRRRGRTTRGRSATRSRR